MTSAAAATCGMSCRSVSNDNRRDYVMQRRFLSAVLSCLMVIGLAGPSLAQGGGPLVFAAASLKNALDDINRQYEAETGKKATISYAASSTLAKQIESGAP